MTTQIIACPSCQTKVRIPSDRGQLKVACPKCSTRWFYPQIVNYLDVAFRCAKDGGHFKITMRRPSPTVNFAIHRIWKTDSTGRQLKPVKIEAALPTPGAAPDSKNPFASYEANEFSWDGFYCPCCGYMGNYSSNFVRCCDCKELVCGCRVTEDAQGDRFFECYPVCGCKGKISGSIESFDGDSRTSRTGPEFTKLSKARGAGELPNLSGTRP